ncbi:hypothetical protein ACFLQY_01655 [Verrucomicrobiota bacterium]
MKKFILGLVCCLLAVICVGEPRVHDPGFYAEIGGGSDPSALWGAGGIEGYLADYFSLYAGVFVAGVEDITSRGSDSYSGLTLGMRFCVPHRVSPYIGAGVAAGWGRYYVLADNDGRDNDNDGYIDESGEEEREYEIINSVFPEAGIHLWLDERQRLTFNYRYHYTSEGEDEDYWTANLGFLIHY